MKYSAYLIFVLFQCLYMHSSAQSTVNPIISAQRNKILRIETLTQLLRQQGTMVMSWNIKLWKTGYEATLEVKETTGLVYTVGVQCYTEDKAYTSLKNKEIFIKNLFAQAKATPAQTSTWLRFFETQAPQVAIADVVLATCDQSLQQTTVTIYSNNQIQIKYSNHWNARSLNHKNNYYMIDAYFDIAEGVQRLNKLNNEFIFGKTMKVRVSDGSSKQNRECGKQMVEKLVELHQQQSKD